MSEPTYDDLTGKWIIQETGQPLRHFDTKEEAERWFKARAARRERYLSHAEGCVCEDCRAEEN